MAMVMMADELTKLQDVYLHAVTRHVLLQREVDAYIASSNSSRGAVSVVEPRRQLHGKGSRRKGGHGDRRERLLAAAARRAPPVSFAASEGHLKDVR